MKLLPRSPDLVHLHGYTAWTTHQGDALKTLDGNTIREGNSRQVRVLRGKTLCFESEQSYKGPCRRVSVCFCCFFVVVCLSAYVCGRCGGKRGSPVLSVKEQHRSRSTFSGKHRAKKYLHHDCSTFPSLPQPRGLDEWCYQETRG